MYIQTQANDKIINVDNVAVIEIVNGEGLKDACIVAADNLTHAEHRTNILLGKYGSRERAEEIMSQIISTMIETPSFNGRLHDDGYNGDRNVYGNFDFCKVYIMPEE